MKMNPKAIIILLVVIFLFSIAYYILTGFALDLGPLFPDIFFPFSFFTHPYSRILVFGLALSGALSLLFGLNRSNFKEQLLGCLAIISALGLTLANDLKTLFFFWELLTISSSALILFNVKAPQWVIYSGMRFFFMHLLGGLLLLFGILLHYAETGSMALELPQSGIIFFILGLGIKAAFIPFYLWIAWGYPAASIYSAVILASLSTKVGVYVIARILPPLDYLVYMGVAMTVVGAGIALMQTNMRRLLSYSLMSQVGYMIAGVSIGSTLAVDGALLHAVSHMLYKALLFMCSAYVISVTGTEELSVHCKGSNEHGLINKPIWKLYPVVTVGALIASLSAAGIPPMSGFVGKTMLKEALYGFEHMKAALSIAGVVNIVVFCRFLYLGFLNKKTSTITSPSFFMNFTIVLASLATVIIGIYPYVLANLLPYGTSLAIYSVPGLMSSLQVLAIGVLIYLCLNKYIERAIPFTSCLSIEKALLNPLIKYIYKAFKAMEKRESDFIVNIGNDQALQFLLLLLLLFIMLMGF